MSNGQPPRTAFTQEVRFAVVMYGGVSLAIYINGVAQELLKLVRATAPVLDQDGNQLPYARRPDNELRGTERVYRKLGQMIARGETTLAPADVRPDSDIRTRFVVDILSGTSAGGINAIYLAKALANDQPFDNLKQLWIEEGDISALINDSESLAGINLNKQDPPQSLLNSRRMYWKLLDALEGMETTQPPPEGSPNVEELDLYVTATDMQGQVVKLQLADKVTFERRHRNVFHFRYSRQAPGAPLNDFGAENNPFLAFTARCTSSIPAAFEPMSLGDIDEVLERHTAYAADPQKSDIRSNYAEWEQFYEEYLGSSIRSAKAADSIAERKKLARQFLKRNFADGGILDNAPFGYVMDAMPLRDAELPVDRKLVYIEPSPGHPELEAVSRQPANFITDSWRALSSLPRYETIREDLQRVLERNRLIERVGRIIGGMEEDTLRRYIDTGATSSITKEWGDKDLAEMIQEKGLAWGSYQRLRVAEVTDDLVALITLVAGLDEDSDEFRAVRYLVRGWRLKRYLPYKQTNGAADNATSTENRFLLRFDFMWRIRRFKFLFAKIDELACLDLGGPPAEAPLQTTGPWDKIVLFAQSHNERQPDSPTNRADAALLRPPTTTDDLALFRRELISIKKQLNELYNDLRLFRRAFWRHSSDHPLLQPILALAAAADWARLLAAQTDQERQKEIERIVQANLELFDDFAREVERNLLKPFTDAWRGCRPIRQPPDDTLGAPERLAHYAIWYYYDFFDDYDMIAHPILYATEVGDELDQIEVFRISPEDATSLVDEKSQPLKLSGTMLGHFGAFFKQHFRISDIMWGQLDAAERIITALLPNQADEPKRKQLILEAHATLIAEDYADNRRLREALDQVLAYRSPGAKGQSEQLVANLAARLQELPLSADRLVAVGDGLKSTDPIVFFKDTYQTDLDLVAQDMVRNTARFSRVFGKMLASYAETQRIPPTPLIWVTRLTQLFWSLVEVAIPGSIPNLVFRHWVKLLYFFELLMIGLGTLLLNQTVQQFGFVAFGITVTAHAAVLLLGDAMAGQDKWWNLIKYLLIGTVTLTSALGIILLATAFGADTLRPLILSMGAAEPLGWNVRTLLRGGLAVVVLVVFLVSIRADVRAAARRRDESVSLRK
jgi:patatin-related protein